MLCLWCTPSLLRIIAYMSLPESAQKSLGMGSLLEKEHTRACMELFEQVQFPLQRGQVQSMLMNRMAWFCFGFGPNQTLQNLLAPVPLLVAEKWFRFPAPVFWSLRHLLTPLQFCLNGFSPKLFTTIVLFRVDSS